MCDRLRRLQPFAVDVVKNDVRFAERFEAKEAREQLGAEVDTARPDECDLGHARYSATRPAPLMNPIISSMVGLKSIPRSVPAAKYVTPLSGS